MIRSNRLGDLIRRCDLRLGYNYSGYRFESGGYYVSLVDLCKLFGFDIRHVRYLSFVFKVYLVEGNRYVEFNEYLDGVKYLRNYYPGVCSGNLLEELRNSYVYRDARSSYDELNGFTERLNEGFDEFASVGDIINYRFSTDFNIGRVLGGSVNSYSLSVYRGMRVPRLYIEREVKYKPIKRAKCLYPASVNKQKERIRLNKRKRYMRRYRERLRALEPPKPRRSKKSKVKPKKRVVKKKKAPSTGGRLYIGAPVGVVYENDLNDFLD